MNEITLTGNIGQIQEIKHGKANGTSILSFSLGINHRERDPRTGKWGDAPTVWQQVVAFGQLAENSYDSLQTGTRVTVAGRLTDDSYTPRGETRRVVRTTLRAEIIAVDLSYATVTVHKHKRPAASTTAPEVIAP
ncbi:single-stranded DNA-binding protein [Pseudonocardia alni]|uniref:single-stranded DNA-binding protein n=1 Tax=Pseudonocardia alni TaxID=33907 RepID=UPI00280AF736|nr:single-stranded DNA-binding protein [Pseudonocardia alni]